MKVEDLKILGQLTLERQGKIEIKLTVKELFIYLKYITAEERVKPEERGKRVNGRTEERVNGRTEERVNERREDKTEQIQPVVSPVPVVPIRKAPEKKKMPLYYTAKDIYEVYNVKEKTLLEWQYRGLLEVHHKRNKICYYKRADVLKIRRETRKE
jgi:hypothetical protein